MNRRVFLKNVGLVSAGTALSGPSIIKASILGPNKPSNRIGMGFIGVGGMGTGNLKAFMSKPQVQVIAICDVDASHCEEARQIANLESSACYNDFHELLIREDIDAVVVSTPDHWHVPISIAAAQSGKDIYCEKPLTLTIAEGRSLSETIRRTGRILQTGSQQRSDSRFRFACELVRNGRIGELSTIKVEIPPNNRESPPTWKENPIPEGFDYEMWLGPAPWEPYTEHRCHYTFRFILDYSGGQITNWGAHDLDIAQWGNDSDRTGPVEVFGKGNFLKNGLFNTATDVEIVYTYSNGVKLYCTTGSNNVRFEGSEGWIFVTRGKIDAYPKSVLDSMIRPEEIHLFRSNNHRDNFLDCIRSRNEPIASVEIGHRSATLCHLGNIAMKLGRKLSWDPEKERFINDPVANSMLSRSMRAPWYI